MAAWLPVFGSLFADCACFRAMLWLRVCLDVCWVDCLFMGCTCGFNFACLFAALDLRSGWDVAVGLILVVGGWCSFGLLCVFCCCSLGVFALLLICWSVALVWQFGLLLFSPCVLEFGGAGWLSFFVL